VKYFFNKNRLIKYSIEDITSNKLIIHHHLGLGDYINCNGMVNYLSNMFDKIIIPLKSNYAHMIKYLYKDNPKIEFLNLENKLKSNIKKLTIEDFNLNSKSEYEQIESFSKKNKIEILRIGHEKLSMPIPKSFYDQLGIPYQLSYDLFSVPYDIEKNNEYEERLKIVYNLEGNYSVSHMESSMADYDLSKLKLENELNFLKIEMKTDFDKNIFYYLKILEKAQEIHLINSSIFCLTDRIKTTGKLFLHNVGRNKNLNKEISWQKNWRLVEYE